MFKRLFVLAVALALLAPPAFSQTNPTGTLSGKVVDPQGQETRGNSCLKFIGRHCGGSCMIEVWMRRMEQAWRELSNCNPSKVHIFYHNDTDGLTSGAILTEAFERKGYTVRRYALEKPYPAVLKKFFTQEGEVLVFADFAGRIAPLLSELNRGRNLVLILDHHATMDATDPKVFNLDPDLFGLKGDLDISASVTCYAFAKVMDPENSDLAYLAPITL